MVTVKIQEIIQVSINQIFNVHVKLDEIEITKPAKKEFGDFSTNISFKLAKQVGKTPKEIAQALVSEIAKEHTVKKAEAVNGFINIFLPLEHYQEIIKQIITAGNSYGHNDRFKDKKIQIEFISANPTGPLTLANGRGGFAGDVLGNLFAKAGGNVQREYYVNDGGNQIKMLGESILVAGGLREKKEDLYKGDYINEWLNSNKESVERLKDKPFELGELAAKDILENYIKPSVEKMNIKFDNWFSEKKLIESGEVEEALERFVEGGLTKEEDGALWFKTTEFGDEKDRVLVKSDGEKTYFANDAAYHWDKLAKRKFDKVVNFWGADHQGHVTKIQSAVSAMGYAGKLDIVIFQLVRLIKDGQEFKMSKRKGTYITTDDLFELIGGPTREASDVARFFFLSRDFNTHMDFDLDLAREHSEKNPVFYVKYAYARISGILAKASELDLKKADLTKLNAEPEMELVDTLSELPGIVEGILALDNYPVHLLTYYVMEVAKKFHSFYDQCRVIDEGDLELTAARLELVRATQIVLRIVMEDLIGIEAPERM